MSDEVQPATKRRPGRPRKRHDPVAAPIDGDYGKDVVHGKDPDFEYALVVDDDMPKMLGRGYVREERGTTSARPHYDLGNETTPGYRVDNLTLMKIPKELHKRAHAQAIAQAERRMAGLRRDAVKRSNSLTSLTEAEYSQQVI